MMASPILMTVLPACLNVCRSRMGSSAGSSSSPTFSSRHGLPKRTAFSRLRRKSRSVSLTTSRPWSFSRFLIHLFACPCGSMNSGQRRDALTITPFSTERLSRGRPAICHWRRRTGSLSVPTSVTPVVCGTCSRTRFVCHSPTSAARYSAVNGLRYAIVPAATMMSPTILTSLRSRSCTVSCQRLFSSPSAPISFFARSSFVLHSSHLRVSSFFLATDSAYFFSSSEMFISTSCSRILASLSTRSVSCSDSCAASRRARFGATDFATKWYLCMARTHWQIDVQALDTLAMTAGWNSSLSIYGWIFWMTPSLMLSLSKRNSDSRKRCGSASSPRPASQ
eukprot:Opistho-1_new@73225